MYKTTFDCFPDCKPEQTLLAVYNDLSDLQNAGKQVISEYGATEYRSEWYGNETLREAVENITKAHPELGNKVTEVMDCFRDLTVQAFRRRRIYSKVGRPVVPRVVANHPLPMSRVKHQRDNRTPLNVIYDVVSSQGCSSDDLLQMGIYTCAFVKVMSEQRPVNLYIYAGGLPRRSKIEGLQISAVLCPINVRPFDVNRAAYLMASQGFARAVSYTLLKYNAGTNPRDGYLNWPLNNHKYGRHDYFNNYWKRKLKGDCLFLGGKFIDDPDYVECKKNPEQWVRRLVKLYSPK